MKIQSGDKVYFHRKRSDYHYCYRTVRSVDPGGVKIYHLGQLITLNHDDIIKVVKTIGDVKRGINTLSESMYQKGLRNEDVAFISGYSIGTVDRARRGIRVKLATLQDIMDSIMQYQSPQK